MKMINTILLSIILLFVCCSKENTSKELFPLSYILVVNDYNNNLKSFNFFTRTYYPDENEMIIYGSGKSKERKITDDRYLHQYDSFVFSPNQFVYRGCITYMELHFDYLDSIGVVSRKYFLTDTIKNNQTVLFVWPNDTIFANKLQFLWSTISNMFFLFKEELNAFSEEIQLNLPDTIYVDNHDFNRIKSMKIIKSKGIVEFFDNNQNCNWMKIYLELKN